MHSYGELVVKADLTEKYLPGRSPFMRKSHFRVPLNVGVVRRGWGVKPDADVKESDSASLSADSEVDLTKCPLKIQAKSSGDPWRCENVLTARVHEGLHLLFEVEEAHEHDRS